MTARWGRVTGETSRVGVMYRSWWCPFCKEAGHWHQEATHRGPNAQAACSRLTALANNHVERFHPEQLKGKE